MIPGRWTETPDGELLFLMDDPTKNQTARLSWNELTDSVDIVWSRGVDLPTLTEGVERLHAIADRKQELADRDAEVGVFPPETDQLPDAWQPPTESEMQAEFERETEEWR